MVRLGGKILSERKGNRSYKAKELMSDEEIDKLKKEFSGASPSGGIARPGGAKPGDVS